jgi:hypothetical protein
VAKFKINSPLTFKAVDISLAFNSGWYEGAEEAAI